MRPPRLRSLLHLSFISTALAGAVELSTAQSLNFEELPEPQVRLGALETLGRRLPKVAEWSLSTGLAWRDFGKLEFERHSLAVERGWGRFADTGSERGDNAVGAATGVGRRDYADGFVNPDLGTSIDGSTGSFGYTTDSQLQGDSLYFHGISGWRETFSQSVWMGETEWNTDVAAVGPMVSWVLQGPVTAHWSVGLEAGAGLWATDITRESRYLTARQLAESYALTVQDRYTHLSGTGALPPAPYTGGTSGIGPLINATPKRTAGERLEARSSAVLEDWFQDEVKLVLSTFSFGTMASFQRGTFSIRGGLGAALHVAYWRANQEERLIVRKDGGKALVVEKWEHSASAVEWLPGIYVNVGVGWKISRRWGLQADVRYDWGRELHGSVGRSQFDLDMKGWTLAVMARYSF